MNERIIFPGLRLFKKTVREHFLIALREIYKIHPSYTFVDSEDETKIHIQPTYADVVYEGKNPQLLVKVGNYEFSLQDTLGGNLMDEVRNNLNVVGGYRSIKNISTTITVIVKTYAEEESSDMADELVLLGTYAAHHMFTQMGINIRGSAVSDTTETDPQNEVFETVVNFIVDVPWELSKVSQTEAIDPETDIEFEDFPFGEYRQPGVYVFKSLQKSDG